MKWQPRDNNSGNDANTQSRIERITILALVGGFGIMVGTCISIAIKHMHYPEEPREYHAVIPMLIMSPISMTLGILPTLGFFGSHGWLVIPGIICTAIGSIRYCFHGTFKSLMLVFVGFVLWSHNNLLAFHALMSV